MSDSAVVDCNLIHVTPPVGMRWIAGGAFRMGDDNAYPEGAPRIQ
jgi:hypothetical protein